jgi:ubiquinone biosynthesis protein
MVFDDGFFHADPHPGSFFIQPSGRIGIIDFGKVGTLDDQLREQVGTLPVAVIREDPDRLARALVGLGGSSRPPDRAGCATTWRFCCRSSRGHGIGEIPIGEVIAEILGIVRRRRLTIPPELVALLRVIVMEEGVAARYTPAFRLGQALAPYGRRHLVTRLSPAVHARSAAT